MLAGALYLAVLKSDSQFYERLYPLVGPSVVWSVRRSVLIESKSAKTMLQQNEKKLKFQKSMKMIIPV